MAEILESKKFDDTLKSLLDEPKDEGEVLNLNDKEDEDKKEEEVEGKKEKEEGEKKEEDGEEQDELDLEEPKEDEIEVLVPPKRKEILAKFPELFKQFPYVEKALYREQQFTEYFPTPGDAKEALSTVETFKKIEIELFNGNAAGVLGAVKKEDPEAFNNLVDNFLININQVDPQAANHVFGNIIKHTVMNMVKEAKQSNDEALDVAARELYKYYFKNADWTPPSNLGKGEKKDDTVAEERKKFEEERFESTYNDLERKTGNVLKSTVTSAIDPKSQMTDYVKSKAIDDVLTDLDEVLSNDKRFKDTINSLWERARKSNYSANAVNSIRKAYLSRCKSELLPLIKKHRDAALRGLGKRVVTKKEDEVIDNRPRNTQVRKDDASTKRKSTFDILNED